MKIGFTGDLVLQGNINNPSILFNDLNIYLKENNINLHVNLESPFVKKDIKSIKQKITLCADIENIAYLEYLSPYLVNLSNNHINDFGNESSIFTINTLKANSIAYYGIGLKNKFENYITDTKNKIVFLSYSERSSDFTGSKLFADFDFYGPYESNLEQIKKLKIKYKGYLIILNIHWGIEDIRFPEPTKRYKAYELIDAGIDIIIGSHPHIIQPFEIYNDKFIFYSIGNFYFPNLTYTIKNRSFNRKAKKHQREGILPILRIENMNIELDNILYIKHNSERIKFNSNFNLKQIKHITSFYESAFKIYYASIKITRFILFAITHPKRLFLKALAILGMDLR